MSDTMEPMPPMPGEPQPPAPSKRSNTPWKVIAAVAVVAAIGSQLPDEGSSTVTGSSPAPATSAESTEATPEPCLDQDAGLSATNRASQALTDASDAADNFDVDRIAEDLHDAADYTLEASQAMEADPDISLPLRLASESYEDAARAVEQGRLQAAPGLMDRATSYVDDATAATRATELSTC